MSLRIALISPFVALAVAGCSKKTEAPAAPAPVAGETTKALEAPAEPAKAAEPEDAEPAEAAEPAAEPLPTGPAALWQTEGFATPESVLVGDGVYYVSNINGAPLDRDDNGFISKIDADGKIIELKWISGENTNFDLHAPKGMAILGDTLYVADIDRVLAFSVATGDLAATYIITGTTFLNAIYATATTLYVTDTAIDADFKPKGTPDIWTFEPKAAAPSWTRLGLEAPGLPNGVFASPGDSGDTVYYNDFADAKLIRGYNRATDTATEPLAVPAGGHDGLYVDKHEDGSPRFFFSSWQTGAVYQQTADGFAIVGAGMKGPADFAVDSDKGIVIVPVFLENRVDAYAILK